MNLLIAPLRTRLCYNACGKLLEYYKPQKTIFLYWDAPVKDLDYCKKNPDRILWAPPYPYISEGDYSTLLKDDEIIPVDAAILGAFSPYLEMALQITGRIRYGQVSYHERVQCIHWHIACVNGVLEKYNIDQYISFDVPHFISDYVIYAMCRIMGISTSILYSAPIAGYTYAIEDLSAHSRQVKTIYEKLVSEYKGIPESAIELPKDYLTVYQKYTQDTSNWTPYYMSEKVAKYRGSRKSLIHVLSRPENKQPILRILKKYYTVRRQIHLGRRYRNKWNRLSELVNLQEKYIYVPLHLQPEATTMPNAGYYANQEMLIRMLSKALPNDVYIYVKENPKQTSHFRDADYPKRLKAIPKVKLISTSFDTYALLGKCVAVACCSGTALWEGLFRGKPGLMFGSFITQYAPGIYSVHTNEQCQHAIDDILKRGSAHTMRDLKLFMLALSKVCFMGPIHSEDIFPYEIDEEKRSNNIFNALVRMIDRK